MSVWVMCGRRRLGKNFLSCCSIGRGRSCGRPVLCGGEAAGHNALRGSGPNQKHAFKDALTQTGSPDPGSTLSALRRHVLANSFKLQTPSSFPGLTSLNRSGFDANQSIALRCRRVGAVHSIKLGHSAMSARCPHCPKADVDARSHDVAQVPEPAVSNRSRAASLFDHLVGAGASPLTAAKGTSVILVLNQYKCIGCSPGKHPYTRTMAPGSDDDSRDSVHDRCLCIAV